MKYLKELLPDKLYQHTYNGDYDYSEDGDGTTVEIQRLNSGNKNISFLKCPSWLSRRWLKRLEACLTPLFNAV